MFFDISQIYVIIRSRRQSCCSVSSLSTSQSLVAHRSLSKHRFLICLLRIWVSPLLCIVDTFFFLHFHVSFNWLSVNSKKKKINKNLQAVIMHRKKYAPHNRTIPTILFIPLRISVVLFAARTVVISHCFSLVRHFNVFLPSAPSPPPLCPPGRWPLLSSPLNTLSTLKYYPTHLLNNALVVSPV